jgi:DNA-binding NarL/FixJ family response regulator
MTAPETDRTLGVLCVDDNVAVAKALEIGLTRAGGFQWKGSLTCADHLIEACIRDCPDLVLLDVDMPGRNPFEVLAELAARCPDTRTVMFSGHVRRDLIERSLDAGAWGYVSKNDSEEELVSVLRKVAAGQLGFSSEARRMYDL